MAAPVYKWLAVDLLTHERLAELPLTGAKWGDRLNGFAPITGNLALSPGSEGATLAAIYVDATTEGRRALYVERDGVLMQGGPIINTDYSSSTRMLKVGAVTWPWILLAKRRITDTKTYTGVDEADIVRDLLDYTQAKPGGDLGILAGTETTGRLRDQTWLYTDNKLVGEAINDMADNVDGFDWSIDVAYDSTGAIVRTLRIWYPRRGRIAGTTGHVFELGRNIIQFGWPTDATLAANSIIGDGVGTGDSAIRSIASDPSQWAAGYPLLEDTLSRKDISVQTTLDGLTASTLISKAQPVALPVVHVLGNSDPELGSYVPGDEARVRGDAHTDPRFPDGIDTYRRIVGWEVTVDDDGAPDDVALVLDQALA